MSIIEIISKLWKNKKLPIINGMIKSDGSFYELDSNGLRLSTLEVRDYGKWHSSIIEIAFLKHLGVTYYCGEGSHGSDGWVLAIDSDNKIKWLFFGEANPLERLWVQDDELHVMSNLNAEWIFPISEPEKLYFIGKPFEYNKI